MCEIYGMAKSRIRHKEPIMGSPYTPYRETCMRAFGLYPWWAFCIYVDHNQRNVRDSRRIYLEYPLAGSAGFVSILLVRDFRAYQ